jgi:hypothetical protein
MSQIYLEFTRQKAIAKRPHMSEIACTLIGSTGRRLDLHTVTVRSARSAA